MDGREHPLKQLGNKAKTRIEDVTRFSGYLDPTDDDQTDEARRPLGSLRKFPATTFVAPSDPDQESKNRNAVRMPGRHFIFLDVGRWLREARDFGVIWGRHVYRCTYSPHSRLDPGELRPGLDADFFNGMASTAQVLEWATAIWAPESDFDWDHLYLILPDMHVMTRETGLAWYGPNARLMQSELDLWEFAKRLVGIRSLHGKLKFIQIGDSFDLWVGRQPRLFQEDEPRHRVILVPRETDATAQVARWVQDIQGLLPYGTATGNWVHDVFRNLQTGDVPDAVRITAAQFAGYRNDLRIARHAFDPSYELWLNPVEAAFRLLEATYGADTGMIYVYGNHDNYLALDGVSRAAGLCRRRRCYADGDAPGILMEHGHRLEAALVGARGSLLPSIDFTPEGIKADTGHITSLGAHPAGGFNYDGAISGWQTTNDEYGRRKGKASGGSGWLDDIAQWWIRFSDQKQFWGELAQVRLGRESLEDPNRKPPHVFVIGHTHEPLLTYVTIRTWWLD